MTATISPTEVLTQIFVRGKIGDYIPLTTVVTPIPCADEEGVLLAKIDSNGFIEAIFQFGEPDKNGCQHEFHYACVSPIRVGSDRISIHATPETGISFWPGSAIIKD